MVEGGRGPAGRGGRVVAGDRSGAAVAIGLVDHRFSLPLLGDASWRGRLAAGRGRRSGGRLGPRARPAGGRGVPGPDCRPHPARAIARRGRWTDPIRPMRGHRRTAPRAKRGEGGDGDAARAREGERGAPGGPGAGGDVQPRARRSMRDRRRAIASKFHGILRRARGCVSAAPGPRRSRRRRGGGRRRSPAPPSPGRLRRRGRRSSM